MPNFNEPVDYTCPLIDGAIELVNGIEYLGTGLSFAEMTRAELEDCFESVKDFDYQEFISNMEETREANSILRDWGNDLAYELRNALSKIEELEGDLETAEGKIEELEAMVKDLEAELESYQEEG